MTASPACLSRQVGDFLPPAGGVPGWSPARPAVAVPGGGACPVGCRLTLPSLYPAGGVPALSPPYPALSLLSCPLSPDPLPRRGRGRPRLFHARGSAPGTPALNRLRHVQTLPSRHPAGWRLFTARIPAAPAGANSLFNAQKPVFRKPSQCRAPPSLVDARGEAPCIRKQ